jgi:hypothetical protein
VTHTPGPAAEVLYLGGPLDGQPARPLRPVAWTLYRYDTGHTAPSSVGDREVCRGLRGLPQRGLYVLAQSRRTGCWSYVHLAMWHPFIAANWTERERAIERYELHPDTARQEGTVTTSPPVEPTAAAYLTGPCPVVAQS